MFDTSWIKEDQIIDGDKFESLHKPLENIIYLTTDSAIKIIQSKNKTWSKDSILITHNSDLPISADIISGTELPKHWFAQNMTHEHSCLTPIPIGLERKRWFPQLHKRETILQYMKSNIKPNKLCLANFSLNTNYVKRKECLNFCSSFSTINADNSVMHNSYEKFIESILNHYFVLCPEGNGIDTHRLWETLYLGRIPIVTSNISVDSFRDLPILIIPSWGVLTQEVLTKYLENFLSGSITYSLKKLNFQFWVKKIKENKYE